MDKKTHYLSSLSPDIVQAGELIDKPNRNRLFIETRLGNRDEEREEFDAYRECQILGAVYAQIRDVFAAPPTPKSGNLPLPSISMLRRQLEEWSVDNETEIILYGPSMALAARGWWVLKWAGLVDVKVLDGGLRAWVDAGGPVAQGVYTPLSDSKSETLRLTSDRMPSIAVDDVEKLGNDALLIDARDESSFYSGRLPGAVNLPASELWTPSTKLRTVLEVEKLLEPLELDKYSRIIAYCGGGVLSALLVLVLSALGKKVELYVGSWSEWIKEQHRIVKSDVEGELI